MWGEGEFLFDIPTMLFLPEMNFIYIPVIYFAAKPIQKVKPIAGIVSFEAENINTIYCLHWVILMSLFLFFGDTGLLYADTAAAPFLWGIIILAAASLVTFLYRKIKLSKKIV